MRHAPLTLLLAAAVAGTAEVLPAGPQLALDPGGHTGPITGVAFRPGANELLSVSKDKTLRVWDLASGAPRRTLRPPIGTGMDGRLYAVAVSPDGRLAAVAGAGLPNRGRVTLIDLGTGEIARTLDGHQDLVVGLAFAPDGRRLASCGDDFTARIWSLADDRPPLVLKHTQGVEKVAFDPAGTRLASASHDATAAVWNVADGRKLATLTGHRDKILAVAWAPDGRALATGGIDGTVRLWTPDGRQTLAHPNTGSEVQSLAFAPDGQSVVYGIGGYQSPQFAVRRLAVATGQSAPAFAGHDNSVNACQVSPDGRWVASAGGDQPQVAVWPAAGGRAALTLAGRGRAAWVAAWSADGRRVAWGTRREGTRSAHERTLARTFDFAALDFGPTPQAGQFRLSTVEANGVSCFRTGPALQVARNNAPGPRLDLPNQLDYSNCYTLVAGDRVAVGTNLGLFLFDARTGQRLRSFRGHAGDVHGVAASPDGRYLVTASLDHTVRVWTLTGDEPLVSLFAAGDEWVAWTPEGYYAASPGGERLMGWHVNNGPDRLATFHPAERFARSLHRPDVIRKLLAKGSVKAALAEADAERGRVSKPTRVDDVLPPAVTLSVPPGSDVAAGVARVTATAAVTATGGRSVQRVLLLLDGKPLPGTEKAPDADGTARWGVDVPPGRHDLSALASSAVSQAASKRVRVRGREAETPVRERLHVLTVGVGKYVTGELNPLPHAPKDAEAIATALEKHGRPPYGGVSSVTLTDAKATRKAVLDALNDLKGKAQTFDTTVVFFAGHGTLDAEDAFYLLPHDADLGSLVATGIEGAQLKSLLSKVRGKVLLVLDACHAGAAGKGVRRGTPDKLAAELSREDMKVIVMCASRGNQVALERDNLGHGVYTFAILQALSGGGIRGLDGIVYHRHVDTFATDKVKELTKGKQVPTIAVPGDLGELPLTKP